jgi:myosin heavy subunit
VSPLTKTFVVLVTILSILLVALVVPFVANTQDFRATVQDLEAKLSTAQTKAATAEDQIASLRQQNNQRISQLQSENADLESQLSEVQQRVVSLQQDLQDAQGRNQQLASSLDVLSAETSQLAQINETKTEQLKSANDTLVDQEGKIIELTNTTDRLQSSLAGQQRRVRELQELTEQYRSENEKLRTQWAQVPEALRQQLTDSEGELVTPGPAIAGQVTAVNQPSDEVTLVQVNVGEKDNVRQNMRFLVHRDGQYLGTLVIDRVDPDEAVGRMQLQKGTVQSGDSVYAGTDT